MWRSLALSVVLACGETPSYVPPSVTPQPDASRAAPPACEPVVGEPELTLELIAAGFDKPVNVKSPAGDPRLFVVEQHTGRVWMVNDGAVGAQPFLDIRGEVSRAMEQGALAIAFHPQFLANRKFYLTYTRRGDDALILEEWLVDPQDPDRASPSSRRQLIQVDQPTDFHNGGNIAFGPDGYLYVGLGDGGPQHDPAGNSQNLSTLLGKFIRIDVDDRTDDRPYVIPPDNPFVEVPGARPEIWVRGVRNPWSWSINPATGHLFFGDIGLAQWEELNVIPASSGGRLNFGWPIVTGDDCKELGCDPTQFTAPLHNISYVVQERCAVIGGHVYRGCRMPGHHGKYFFSDFCAAYLRSFYWSELDADVDQVTEWDGITSLLTKVSALGVDDGGELLVLDWEDGRLHRVVPAL